MNELVEIECVCCKRLEGRKMCIGLGGNVVESKLEQNER